MDTTRVGGCAIATELMARVRDYEGRRVYVASAENADARFVRNPLAIQAINTAA